MTTDYASAYTSTKTCKQRRLSSRTGQWVTRYLPHDVPSATYDPCDGYAECKQCGALVYVGTGLNPNTGMPI